MRTYPSARDLALILAVVTLWGFSFVPIKVGLLEMPPFAFAAIRFALAAIPLVLFIKPPRIPARFVVLYGFAIGVCQFGLLFLGMKLGMPAGLSSLVIQLQVFFTIGLGIALLGDRLHAENAVGATIATIGIILLALHKIRTGATTTFIGLVLVIVSALAWGIGNVAAKRAAGDHEPDMFALVVWSSLVPPIPLALLSYLFEGADAWQTVANAGWLAWGCALFLAYVATLFGFASWARLLHRYPTSIVSPFALLIPISGSRAARCFSTRRSRRCRWSASGSCSPASSSTFTARNCASSGAPPSAAAQRPRGSIDRRSAGARPA